MTTYGRVHLKVVGTTPGAAAVAKGDTGRLQGEVQQMRWYPTTLDTGCPGTLTLAILPVAGDSGAGWSFHAESVANLGVGFTRAPRQPQHGADGAPDPSDTGAAFGVPIVGANDRIRLKVAPGDTGVVIDGDLYVWVKQ